MPAYPGWTPQSNMTLLPLYLASTHDRPTSEPAPRGMISSMSSPSVGAPVAAMDRFIPAEISIGGAAMSAGGSARRTDPGQNCRPMSTHPTSDRIPRSDTVWRKLTTRATEVSRRRARRSVR
jgi:hypothetical protein